MKTPRRLPEDFNPWKAVAALKGIAMTIEWFVTEGPGAEQPMPRDAQITLHGLAHASRLFADQFHAWLEKLDEAGVELPRPDMKEKDSEVREPASPPYLVN